MNLAKPRNGREYLVTPSGHRVITQRRFTPDWAWDLMMRAQFLTPKARK
jgi:hypothetical protein